MPTFTVDVQTRGTATITAATKAEAERLARAGQFECIRHWGWSALISTLQRQT